MNLSRRKFFQVAAAGCGAVAAGGLLAGKAKATVMVPGPPPCMVDMKGAIDVIASLEDETHDYIATMKVESVDPISNECTVICTKDSGSSGRLFCTQLELFQLYSDTKDTVEWFFLW